MLVHTFRLSKTIIFGNDSERKIVGYKIRKNIHRSFVSHNLEKQKQSLSFHIYEKTNYLNDLYDLFWASNEVFFHFSSVGIGEYTFII